MECVIPGTKRLWTRRAAALVAALSLTLVGCDSGQIAAPVNTGVQWSRITNPSTNPLASYPDWRGDRIAFSFSDGTHANIATCRPDGSDMTYLSKGASEDQLEARWADDSVLIYRLRSSSSTTGYDLWLRNLATDEIRQLTAFAGSETSPAPRPGTTGLVYTQQQAKGRLVLIPDYTVATPEQIYLTGATQDCGEAAWDAAGQRICFTADSSTYRHVWMLTLAAGDSTPVQLTTGPYFDMTPRFSSDGTRILFASNKRTGRPGIWTISPSGAASSLKAVAFGDIGSVVATPCWSPDETRIVTVSTSGGQALWVLSNLP